jgi:hypothetical protein
MRAISAAAAVRVRYDLSPSCLTSSEAGSGGGACWGNPGAAKNAKTNMELMWLAPQNDGDLATPTIQSLDTPKLEYPFLEVTQQN